MKLSTKNIPPTVITLCKLGFFNILRVITYRIQCKIGYFKHFFPINRKPVTGNFFDLATVDKIDAINPERYLAQAENLLAGEHTFFFSKSHDCGTPPKWLYNPYTKNTWPDQAVHWSELQYFSKPGEDIKIIWELSRFYWAPQLACAYRLRQKKIYLDALNTCITDWIIKNPSNQGVQWLCAQEASIRMINLLLAHFILGNNQLSSALQELVIRHCKRIAPTMHYARAQQNNHATSEAAGLYIGSVFLLKSSSLNKKQEKLAKIWLNKGKKYLEKGVAQLVMNDGSFSQYSVTYHRLMLDTLSLSVHIQCFFKLPNFSRKFLTKYELAFKWLYAFTDKLSFDALNLGSNDGTALFDINLTSYRDFRQSLQFASTLLYGKLCFQEDQSCDILRWLNLPIREAEAVKETSCEYLDGGFVKFYSKNSWAMLRYPIYHFRPSQCDAMHFDLWIKGINVLCDSGTYSYNPPTTQTYNFSSVAAHNTVQIDHHDQMKKFSRFLYMEWLSGSVIRPLYDDSHQIVWQGSSRDAWDSIHKRKVTYENNRWEIEDAIENFKENVIVRWHLADMAWFLENNDCISSLCDISIFEGENKMLVTLEKTIISTHYLTTSPGYCLIANINVNNRRAITLKTIISIHGVN